MIKKTLKVLFQRANSEQLISDCWNVSKLSHGQILDGESFIHLFRHDYPNYTLDQIKNIKGLLSDNWMVGKQSPDFKYNDRESLYNVVLRFAESALEMSGDEPTCKYEQVLDWHELSMHLGEDLFSTAFVASRDAKTNATRHSFLWPPYLNAAHPSLNRLLEQPLTDLHAHLKGTSLNFDLNWLSLMNHIQNRAGEFRAFGVRQHAQVTVGMNDFVSDLYYQVMKASAIRLYLFAKIKGRGQDVSDCLRRMLFSQNRLEATFYCDSLQALIDSYRHIFGNRYYRNESSFDIVDYAINEDGIATGSDLLETVLTGERAFLYSLLKRCYEGGLSRIHEQLLTVYLIIKTRFRHEMVQLNEGVGFDNFATYEERKTAFIQENSVYDKLVAQLAIGNFSSKKSNNRYMEARIVPKESGRDIHHQIMKIDRDVHNQQFNDARGWNYYYIYHFIKTEDKTKSHLMELVPRHHALRMRVSKQARAICAYRNFNFIENIKRVVGIDAANSEIQARPEVFAQAYRYLRNHAFRNDIWSKPDDLRMTYHVGEDYLDVADGLRAYDEVIKFLRFGEGDRLGHALVLGVDVDLYYSRRQGVIAMPMQMILDNIVWLYQECISINDPFSIIPHLKNEFSFYFHEVFGDKASEPPIDTYYRSWLLRGDNPFCYQVPSLQPEPKNFFGDWEQNNLIVDDTEILNARHDDEARKLCYYYHFNKTVKVRGAKVVEYKVSRPYVESLKQIKEEKLKDAEKRKLAIECNPTSNFRIGEFKEFDEHPITVFSNAVFARGGKCHNISASINTDDAGVFATSIEREYAVMAKALENKYCKHGGLSSDLVFDWLEQVRLFGQDQRFVK